MSTRLATWHFRDVRMHCHGRVSRIAQPRLLVRLRGRLGQCLHGHIPDVWFERLFPAGGDQPPPFVLRIDGYHGPVLTVRLFGQAAVLADAVAEALHTVGREGLIVAGSVQPLLAAGPAMSVAGQTILPTFGADVARIRLATPLCLPMPQPFSAELLLQAIVRRITKLASWLEEISIPTTPARGTLTAIAMLQPCSWIRIAHRQHSRLVPMAGWRGEVQVSGQLDELAHLLAVAESCHIGRHASFGMGRLEIVADR